MQKCKAYSSFMDNIWETDLADGQLITKDNKGIHFYSVFEMFLVIACVNPLKDKQLLKHFKKLKKLNCKPNKIWEDKGSEFSNKSLQLWLEDNIEIHSANNEWKIVVVEQYIKLFKNKI